LSTPPTVEETAGSKNYRNWYYKKTVKTQIGEIPVKIPRDHNGEYEPKIKRKMKKRQGLKITGEILSFLMSRKLKEKWGKSYPSFAKSWEDNGETISTFYSYPAEIWKIIYQQISLMV
jgi:transposase-like protein